MSNQGQRLIFQSGNVFDSLAGTIRENSTVVVLGNRIVWVGDESDFEKEPKDEIIDGAGKTILPGLIECHVHLAMNATALLEREYLRTTAAMWHYYALRNAQRHLVSGFTCVRDCGTYTGWGSSLRRILNQGVLAGPRLLIANQGIFQWGNQERIGPDWYLSYLRDISEVTSGINGMKHAVRERKHSGADFIKIATTGGVMHGADSKIQFSLFLDEELLAITEEAHRLGMHVASHAHGEEGIRAAVKANVDTIEHGSFITEDIADAMIKKGTFLIPTQNACMNMIQPDILKEIPPEYGPKIKQVLEHLIENHQVAFEKGVLMAIGTDAGTPGNFHGTTGSEIKNMVKNVGMTPSQALQAATIQGAKAIQMDNEIGSIEKGKYADLVICDKNPLEDISIVENPMNFAYVIKDGKIIVERGQLSYLA